MNIEDEILIERFLRNLLSKTDQQQVLERIERDPVFKDKVDFERELLESLNDHNWHFIKDYNKEHVKAYTSILKTKELTDLKAELKRINAQHRGLNKEVKQLNWKRILISSAAIFAIMFSVYLFTNRETSPQELYVEYLDTLDLPSLVNRNDSNNQLAKAQDLFENANYIEALKVINEALISTEENASVYLYKGITEMQLDKFTEANTTFNALINSNFIDAQKGYWYKALLYLKQGDKERAKEILKDIVSQSYYNANKAKGLLEHLN